MPLNRRSILKALALAPGLPILNSTLAQALMSQGNPTSTYILLHGMWFMAFENNFLWAATPQHNPHHFHMRDHGGPLQALSSGDIDLTGIGTGLQSMTSFPSDVVQFSASSMQRTIPVISAATKFQTRLKFPLPKEIFAYRTDTTDNLPVDGSTKVGQSIFSFAGPRLGTITCLEYDSAAPFIRSYYAEHPGKVGSIAINLAFRDAADAGFLGPNFDLKVFPGFVPDANRDRDDSLPPGVLGDDEATLEEVGTTVALYRPMILNEKPAQAAGEQPLKPIDKSPAQPQQHKQSNTATKNKQDHTLAADIASCPQFGINP